MRPPKRPQQIRDLSKKLACGRSLAEQFDDVRAYGNQAASPVLRMGILAAHGIVRPKDTATNGILFGCYRPFTTPFLLRDALALLDRLGVDYTWLDKEYCCGLPMLGDAPDEEYPAAVAAAREFAEKNAELAKSKGAERIVSCCAGCVQVARGARPEAKAEHAYILDLILDHMTSRSLRVAPLTIGYFEGCHTGYAPLFPEARLDWPRYRAFLDGVQGLTVTDLTGMCCKRDPGRIIAKARELGLSAIVCPCSGCVGTLSVTGRGQIAVHSYPELLLRALEGAA
jgi:Fe-S oxidoreductase